MATTLSIAASNAAQLEGSSGSKAFTFTVNRTGDLSGVSSVLWRVVGVGSTPANAADFLNGVLPSGTVSFAAGESSKIISVDVSGDLVIESNESFSFVLYSSTGAAIGTSTAIGTILSDDLPSISLSLSQASVAEDGSNNLAYIFSRTGSTAAPLAINYIVRGTANSDDYASLPSGNIKSITFAAGASTTTLVIDPTADSLAEIDETVEVILSPTTFYTISTPAAVVGTIVNDDTNLAITPASISQQEGNSGVTYYTFTVTRTGILSGNSTAQWSVAGIGQQADANDFPGGVLPTGSVTFAAGETIKTITIEVNGDTIAENDETFAVTLANPTGATITTATASGTIVNDDTNLAITPATVSQKEGNIGGTIFNFTVIRTGVVTGTSIASWIVAGNGDHPVTSDDFIGDIFPAGIVTFAAGETEQNIVIEIKGDSISEASERFRITLFNPSGATITTDSSNGVIIDDDLPIVNLSLNQLAVSEDGNENLIYVFTRTGPALDALTVYYTISGSADSNDYSGIPAGSPKSITFLAGESSVSLVVDPMADALAEADETVAITLSANGDYIRETTTAVIGTIVNDDTNLAILPAIISQPEGNSGITHYTFTVTRTGLLSGSSSAQWSVAGIDGQPADANDFPGGILPTGSVTFAAGETTKIITIEVNGDSIAENDETFAVTLTDPTGATITTATASGTIVNDDTNLAITPPTISQPEGNSGVTHYTFTVTRTGLLSGSSTAQWSVTGIDDQPADANDFGGSFPIGTITFAAGETSKIITVEVNGDIIAESDEKFAVVLSNPAGTTISTASAEGVIVNDDTNLGIVAINADQVEGNSGSKSFTFAIQRTGVLSSTSTTSWAAAGSGITPADASDFAGGILPSGTVSFAPGEASKLISIDIKGDTEIEPDETFSVTLYDSSEETPQNPTATGTIISDEPITISLALQPSIIAEDGGQVFSYTFTRNGPTDAPLTINFLISGSADPTNDYTSDRDLSSFPFGSITFNPGDSTAILEIKPTADTTIENDETIEIELLTSSEYAVGTVGPVVAIINNNDQSQASLAISATDATKAEGNSGKTAYTFSVKRSGDTSGSSTAEWAVSSTQATGDDFIGGVLPSGTVSFAAGDTSKTITVEINGDSSIETDESFTVTLANPTGATITTASTSGTIIDDDIATTALKPISYDMLNGETGWYNYWDESYTGVGNRFQDLSPLSGGLGDLTDGVIPAQSWDVTEAPAGPGPYVAWLSVNPSITFNFGKNVDIDRVIVHVDDSSFSVVRPPQSIRLSMAGNTFNSGQINDPPGAQPLAYVFSGLNFHGDSLKLDLVRRTWVFVSEVEFFGRESGPSLPTLAIVAANADQSEGDAGAKAFTFTVTRTGDTSGPSSAAWAVTGSGSNPANGADFAAAGLPSGTVLFAAGETSQTISVNVNGDSSVESDESFIVTITNPTGARISNANASGTISNDDFPAISLAVAPASVTEDGTGNLVYTFTRTGPTTSALTVNYTVSGTASLGGDYGGIASTPTTKTVNFAAGSATATVTVDPTADTEIETDETVSLTLVAGTGYTIGTNAAVTGTISNDDPTITLAVSPATVAEDGTSNLIYTFTRTGSTTSALTVNYTISGTASLGGDYSGIATTPTTKTVSFAAGSATATVTVDPTADTEIEADETVALTLAAGTNYFIGTTNAVVGTITNDDFPAITLALAPASVTEDGTSNLVYMFTRTGPITSALTVNYTVSGTATLGSDYSGIATTPTSKTVSFAAGSATATVTVDPSTDTAYEEDETVALTLAAGTGYTIGTTNAVVGTITNDDLPAITLAVSPATMAEDGSSNLIYTFTRTGSTTSALTVNYTVAGTATIGSDYSGITAAGTTKTVTFAAGSASAIVAVDPLTDAEIESNETVSLTLAAGVDYTVATTTAVVATIVNDDFPIISLAVSPATVAEDGAVNLVYIFSRTGATTSELTVAYGITGTANASDYTGATPGTGKTITFAAGSAIATLAVDPIVDASIEADETVALTLAAGVGYTVGTTAAVVGTIINDDFPIISLISSSDAVAEDASGNLVYTFSRTGPTASALTVNYDITGTADAFDYTGATPGLGKTIIFAVGSSTATLTIDPKADITIEPDETVTIAIAAGTGYTIDTTTAVSGTIIDDDFPAISLSVNPDTVLEDGTSNLVYSFYRTGQISAPLTVYYTVGGTASIDDYSGLPDIQEITFAAGQSSVDLVVNPTADNLAEADEAVSITLSANSAYKVVTGTTISGTIINDETSLAISPKFIRKTEGNIGTTAFTYTVTRTGALGESSSASWSTIGVGGQPANAADFAGSLLPSGIVRFAAGETRKNITILASGDAIVEPNETFNVVLSNPRGATIGYGGAPVENLPLAPSTNLITGLGGSIGFGENILSANDDRSTGAIDLTSVFPFGLNFFGSTYNSIYLNNNGNITFYSPLSAYTPSPITQLTASPIIAPFYADVDTRAGALVASPGGTSKGSNLVYWDLDPVNRQATFTWDDVGKYSWGTSPNAFQLVLKDVGLGNLQIDFRYENIAWLVGDASGGTLARAGYSLGDGYTFYELPQSGTTQMSNLELASNIGQPGLYRFTLPVVNLPSIARGLIVNDDTTVSISPSSLSYSEGASPTYLYTIIRNGDLSLQSSVAWQVHGQWGIDRSDFWGSIMPSGTVVFEPGETTKTIQVKVQDDLTVESDETFVVNLHSTVNTAIAQNNATGTILNNDFPRRTGGDIHVVTYDGLAYPFQNSGIFTLTRSNPGDLNLAVFLDWVDEAKSVSFATEVALKMENHAFHLKATWDDFFEIDYKGNTQSLANSESITIDGIKIRRAGKSLIFVNGKNEEIHIIDQGSYFDFSYSLSPLRMGYLQGLMGNYDGNQSNDNQPSWLSSAVQISNSPFAAFIGQDDYRPSFQLPPITRRYEDIPQSVIDYVTSVLLAQGITDEVLILQAAYDAWVTGDNTYLDDATDFNDSVNLVSPPPPPCFMSGTLIDTPSGEVPIETLKPGGFVLTPTGPQAIKFLGKTTRKASAIKPQAKMPIRINKGSLGSHLPVRDTYCTPSHAFVVDDCLVEARALVNNESITNIEKWPDLVPIIYFSIELEDHQLVWANGLLTETYYSNWTSTGFSREAWDNYSTYLELYQESKPMNELPMARIPFARQLPLRIRERFKLGSCSGAIGLDYSREELCLTL